MSDERDCVSPRQPWSEDDFVRVLRLLEATQTLMAATADVLEAKGWRLTASALRFSLDESSIARAREITR